MKVPEVPVISSRKSKKDRQYNGQKKKDKGTINDLQNTTHKTKDWAQKGWQDQLVRVEIASNSNPTPAGLFKSYGYLETLYDMPTDTTHI